MDLLLLNCFVRGMFVFLHFQRMLLQSKENNLPSPLPCLSIISSRELPSKARHGSDLQLF
jgi:hypothetical protein